MNDNPPPPSGGGVGAADGGGDPAYFYRSNPIARASATMAECVRDIVEASQPILEAAE